MIELETIKAKKEALDSLIMSYQKNMRLLLDFATGHKKLNRDIFPLKQFQNDPLRLAATLKNLHSQLRTLQKERDLLNQLLKKSASSVSVEGKSE